MSSDHAEPPRARGDGWQPAAADNGAGGSKPHPARVDGSQPAAAARVDGSQPAAADEGAMSDVEDEMSVRFSSSLARSLTLCDNVGDSRGTFMELAKEVFHEVHTAGTGGMCTELASDHAGAEKPPIGADWLDDAEEPIWLYTDGSVLQQVQKQQNVAINNAIVNQATTVKTHKETHRGRKRFDVHLENKTMQDTGGNQVSLSLAQLRDVRDDVKASAPFWQFAENWGWYAFSADHQKKLEAAFQSLHATGEGGILELSHQWTKRPQSRPERQVVDWYGIDLRQFTSTAMQDKRTVRRIRRVQRVTGADVRVGDTIADASDDGIPAAGTVTHAASAADIPPDQLHCGHDVGSQPEQAPDQLHCGHDVGSQPEQRPAQPQPTQAASQKTMWAKVTGRFW